VMIAMNSSAGTYIAYEAVQPNPGVLGGANSMPLSSCGSPTNWSLNTPAAGTAQNATQFREVNLATTYETTNNISATIFSTSSGTLSPITTGYLCFTPLGRTYLLEGGAIQPGMFNAATPMSAALQIEVARKVAGAPVGIVRSVLVPPNGVTRMLSNSTLVAP
jgi:hypothetical protein